MRESVYRLNSLSGNLLDVDITREGSFVGIVGADDQRTLLFGETEVGLPEFIRFPLVRTVNKDCALVVDTRTEENRKANAWIVERSGETKVSFFAGDGIADVLVSSSRIVVTYFDEGVFSGIPPSEQGLAVFNLTGKLTLEYQKQFGAEAVDIADCYCACWADDSRLFFSPYTGFPLVELNLASCKQQVYSIPKEVHGSAALSVAKDTAYFHSPYENKGELFALKIGQGVAKSCGRYHGRLRGLAGGKFLACGNSGYTIISPDETDT